MSGSVSGFDSVFSGWRSIWNSTINNLHSPLF